MVEFVVNHRPRDVLGGRCAIEVTTGHRPRNVLEMVLWKGLLMKDTTKMKTTTARVEEFYNDLFESLGHLHEEVVSEAERKQSLKATRQARTPGMRFSEGDLVIRPSIPRYMG